MDSFLTAYGLPGMMIAGLAGYIMWLHHAHEKRVKRIENQHSGDKDDWKEIARDGFQNIKENTTIISALKTILETTRERIK